MKNRYFISPLIFLFCFSFIQAQVIKSEKAYLQLSNKTKKEVAEKADKTAPEIKIISPAVKKGTKYISAVPDINFIGKATDESGISTVFINSELKEVTEAGVFTTELILEPGDNEITVIAMDNKDNYMESKIVIEYSPPKVTFAEKVNK